MPWHLLDHGPHAGVQALVRDLNRLYREQPALHRLDCQAEGFEWIAAHDAQASVFAWVRRDDQGRAVEVEFRASALGRSTHYTLSYDYSQAPNSLGWHLVRGDIMRTIDGAYQFTSTADGGTEVRYDLTIDLVVPLPGFVKRRAEVRIVNSVKDLKARVESR